MPFKLLYPGHNYLGPGNPLENGPTVDNADKIAKRHDYEYHNASTEKQVFESDEKAVSEFSRDFVTHPNLPSLAGAVGLSLKHGIEKNITGVLYPTGMPKKNLFFRNARANDNRRIAANQRREVGNREGETTPNQPIPGTSAETPSKRPATFVYHTGSAKRQLMQGSGGDAMDTDMQNDQPVTSAVSRDANNSAGGMRGTAEMPIGLRNQSASYRRTYTKQYKLRIFNELAQYDTPDVGGVRWNDFIPPYHDLPVDLVAFYLDQSEMQRLRTKTKVVVKQANVNISNKTAILTYETNAAGTQIGNNNLGVTLIQLDPNINKHRTGEGVPSQGQIIRNYFWGADVNGLPITTGPSTNLSGISSKYVFRNYSNKYRYRTLRANTGRSHDGSTFPITPMQFFNVDRHVVMRKNVSMVEGSLIDWSYTPQNGLIFAQQAGLFPPGEFTGIAINLWAHHDITNRMQNGGATAAAVRAYASQPVAAQPVPNTYASDVFKNIVPTAYSLLKIDDEYVSPSHTRNQIPVLSFGIEPQVAINQSTNAVAPIPCHVDLIVSTSIELEITEGIDYDDSNYGLLQEINYKFPDYRTYRYDGLSDPAALLGPLHTELPCDNEIPHNSVTTTNTVASTWTYASVQRTDQEIEDEEAEKNKRIKAQDITSDTYEDPPEYARGGVLTRAQWKLLQKDLEKGKKNVKKTSKTSEEDNLG